MSLRKDSPSRAATSSRVEASSDGVHAASRVASFTESVIREMTRLSDEITWDAHDRREAIAASYEARDWPSVDPVTDVTVICGSTEAMAATFLSSIDPGDETILPVILGLA